MVKTRSVIKLLDTDI